MLFRAAAVVGFGFPTERLSVVQYLKAAAEAERAPNNTPLGLEGLCTLAFCSGSRSERRKGARKIFREIVPENNYLSYLVPKFFPSFSSTGHTKRQCACSFCRPTAGRRQRLASAPDARYSIIQRTWLVSKVNKIFNALCDTVAVHD